MGKSKNMQLKDLMKFIKNKKKSEVVNSKLKSHLKGVVGNLIINSSRKEAIEILEKSSRERIGEFLYYYHSDIGNVACCVLDSAKDELVADKKMKKGKKDSFGGIKY